MAGGKGPEACNHTAMSEEDECDRGGIQESAGGEWHTVDKKAMGVRGLGTPNVKWDEQALGAPECY